MSRSPLAGLLSGSTTLLILLNLANVLHVAFHVIMARMLGPEGYGAVAAVLAIFYVANVLAETVQTVLARAVAAGGEIGKGHDLLARALARAWQATGWLALAFAAAALPMARLLHLPPAAMALLALALPGVFLLPVCRGTLQGLKRFGSFGGNALLEVVVKLGLGAGLVALGLGVNGAVAGIGAGLALAFVAVLVQLADVRRTAAVPTPLPHLAESFPVLVVTATVWGFLSLDVLLARIFFPAGEAGQYAVASLVGKGIFLGTLPITRALIPLSTEHRHARPRRLLGAALGLCAACAAPVLAALWLAPELVVRLIAGGSYPRAGGLTLALGAAMTLMAASNAILLYKLSTATPRGSSWLPALVLVEAAALYLARGSLDRYALAVLGANLVFLLAAALLPAREPKPI